MPSTEIITLLEKLGFQQRQPSPTISEQSMLVREDMPAEFSLFRGDPFSCLLARFRLSRNGWPLPVLLSQFHWA